MRLTLAHEFRRAGHEVEFVLMRAEGELLEEAQETFPVVDLAVQEFRNLPPTLIRHLRQKRPDALLAAMWPLTGIAALACRLTGLDIRLVASEHADFRLRKSLKSYERLALKYFGRVFYSPCHSVVAVSEGVAASLCEVAGLAKEKITVIHNPVRALPLGEVSQNDRQVISGWLESKIKLIAIGSLKDDKGFDVLLQALVEIRNRYDAKLLILGEGSLRNDLEKLSRELGISDELYMPGFRPNPGIFLQHASVFVLSSNWEGFGNVIVEALATGVPVVSTDCLSGPAEILEGGRYGRLVPLGDWRALAKAVEATLLEERQPEILIKRAEEFSPDVQANLYMQLLEKPKSPI